MADYTPHTLVVLEGTIDTNSDSVDIWQCNIRVSGADVGPGGGPVSDAATYLHEIGPHLATWFHDPGSAFSNLTTLDVVKANNINAAGHYSSPSTNFLDYAPHIVGGNPPGAGYLPDFITCVTSWGTAVSRGRGHRGHVSLPFFGFNSSSPGTPRFPPSQVLIALASAKNLLTVLVNGTGTIEAIPMVMSGLGAQANQITSIRAGDVMNVQTRRKNALTTHYQEVTFP